MASDFPLDPNDKPSQERQVWQVIEESGAELVILARYMQVLSPELCRKLDGKAINIHHSLLPGFKGAKPYHQAYNKGVKLVGATAHYINNDLDEGPIIAQGAGVCVSGAGDSQACISVATHFISLSLALACTGR